MIITDSACRISTKFHTDIPWVDIPTPVDFRTGPTSGLPPSGNFSPNVANLVFDDYLWKYLSYFNKICHRCPLSGCLDTCWVLYRSDIKSAPWWQFLLWNLQTKFPTRSMGIAHLLSGFNPHHSCTPCYDIVLLCTFTWAHIFSVALVFRFS